MSAAIERIPWDVDHADGYLRCLDIPLGDDSRPGACANHYDGIAPVGLESRLRKHSQGKGAKLTAHARRAGIGWTLTRIWEDIDRIEERRLKENAGMHWCPRCCTERVMAAQDPAYGQAITAAKAQYQATVQAGRIARQEASSKSAGTRAWNRAVEEAREQLQQTRHDAAAEWVAAHPRPGLRAAALACVVDGTPMVTPPMRARQRGGRARHRGRPRQHHRPGRPVGQASSGARAGPSRPRALGRGTGRMRTWRAYEARQEGGQAS
jgi:hypothetical protein